MVKFTLLKAGDMYAAPTASLAAGELIEDAGTKVNAIADRPMGIILDEVPSEGKPPMVDVYGRGTFFNDDTMDGVSVGNKVFSDGDGTYSVTEPAGAAGTLVWIFGIVRRIDTAAADTGCDIEIVNLPYEKGA